MRSMKTVALCAFVTSLMVGTSIYLVWAFFFANGILLPQRIQATDALPVNNRIVCYYDVPKANGSAHNDLQFSAIKSNLCTHINIGSANIENGTLVLSTELQRTLRDELPILRARNCTTKFLLWIGGADTGVQFATMVATHERRKVFVHSMKTVINQYALDGIDLDWEFPSAYNKERQHLSQLLYEIRQEFKRESHNERILSVAVAAPEGIAFYAYDIRELNQYADYVNLMTYDYHFYTTRTPFTGLNAPLYARTNEQSILSTFNINYSVHWWLSNGIDPTRLVVGLPTYGHSFTLVNPFNNAIGAPAESVGDCGNFGFTTYYETCQFAAEHLQAVYVYDNQTCSPYITSGQEWISFENEKSIECKTRFVKSLNLGGVMVFSLNTDDTKNICDQRNTINIEQPNFPLVETIKRILTS